MIRNKVMVLMCAALASPVIAQADVVTDWNVTLNDAIIATPSKHNPGDSTRAMAMTNASIYDVFQAISRTHVPFKVNASAPAGANLEAAVAQAAYRTISDCFGEQQATLDSVLATRLGGIVDTPQAIQDGIDLGNYVAQHYINVHANDGHDLPDAYTPTDGPGHWSSDPMVSPAVQKGWGSDWGYVTPWAMPESDHFDAVIDLPAFGSQEYVDAFNQVKAYGERNSMVRTPDQTAIGLFWAYDRPNLPGKPGVGPPPVLFIENLMDIGAQAGNAPADNARLFAMASVSMADAAIAAWDVKYEEDFWRPITAIRADAAHDDDDPATIEDPNWAYLGAPGFDPNSAADDFTPPFPAYTSGHATMGGAVFKALEMFYGTNDFGTADAMFGVDPVNETYSLTSHEFAENGVPGMSRDFKTFTMTQPLDVGVELLDDSPEGENGISRVYLGIHWLFDQQDGIALGNAIAQYAAANHFQAVPEPSVVSLMAIGLAGVAALGRRRK